MIDLPGDALRICFICYLLPSFHWRTVSTYRCTANSACLLQLNWVARLLEPKWLFKMFPNQKNLLVLVESRWISYITPVFIVPASPPTLLLSVTWVSKFTKLFWSPFLTRASSRLLLLKCHVFFYHSYFQCPLSLQQSWQQISVLTQLHQDVCSKKPFKYWWILH